VDHAEAFLLDQVPLGLRPMIPTTLKNAYTAARVLIEAEPVLSVTSARDNAGRIVQWAVDLGFEKLVQSGQWPFDCRWRYFDRPTGRYFEILPTHSVITISQITDPTSQPRNVGFRENKRLNTQRWLTNLPDPRENRPSIGLPHILLVHGHQELDFAHLGIPNEHHSQGYAYRTPNLMLMPHAVPSPEPAPEQTDVEAVMTLKEEIDKWRRDNVEG
jgi:hypothetical protein